MRVLVMGAGVVGVTTAYELVRDGHEVVVLEGARGGRAGDQLGQRRHGGTRTRLRLVVAGQAPHDSAEVPDAEEPGLALSPAGRSTVLVLVAPVPAPVHPRAGAHQHPAQAPAQPLFARPCCTGPWRTATSTTTASTAASCSSTAAQETLDRGVGHMRILADNGQAIEVLDRDALVALEPSLAAAKDAHCRRHLLPERRNRRLQQVHRGARRRGGPAWAPSSVTAPRSAASRWRPSGSPASPRRRATSSADAYVLALGNQSAGIMARRIGIRLPIYPVKGYSLTIPGGQPPAPAHHRRGGRGEPDRHIPLRRPHAPHRDRRDLRLRHRPQAARLRLSCGRWPGSSTPKAATTSKPSPGRACAP